MENVGDHLRQLTGIGADALAQLGIGGQCQERIPDETRGGLVCLRQEPDRVGDDRIRVTYPARAASRANTSSRLTPLPVAEDSSWARIMARS